jgi:Zn finger protein HypA/HybF involved in hydrogenase expression
MKEIFGANIPEPYSIRCYSCGKEFQRNLTINDDIGELDCPFCFKNTVELNLGKKI